MASDEEGEILEDGEVVDDDGDENSVAATSGTIAVASKNQAHEDIASDSTRQDDTKKGQNREHDKVSMPPPTARKREEGRRANASSNTKGKRRRVAEFDGEEDDQDPTARNKRKRWFAGGDTHYRSNRSPSNNSDDESEDVDDDESDCSKDVLLKVLQDMIMSTEPGMKEKAMLMMTKMMAGKTCTKREMKELMQRKKQNRRPRSMDRELEPSKGARRGRDRDNRDNNNRRGGRGAGHGARRVGKGEVHGRGNTRDRQTTKEKTLCKFFLEGKCNKSDADCVFSHQLPQQHQQMHQQHNTFAKKKEICKFYLQGFCGKQDACHFMHRDFPCKFFHTGVECYSGDNCRFSHEPLTDETRNMLKGYLDSGDLPGDHHSPNNASQGSTGSPHKPYQPMKPVQRRHAVLGEVTTEMRRSPWTWTWQREMKDLELAYTGNKRNLFCIEKEFVMAEEPKQAQHKSDSDQRQVMSYYIDTMPNNNKGGEHRIEEERLFEMSQHDEDLRLPPSASDVKVEIKSPDISTEGLSEDPDRCVTKQEAEDLWNEASAGHVDNIPADEDWNYDDDDDDTGHDPLHAAMQKLGKTTTTTNVAQTPISRGATKPYTDGYVKKIMSVIKQSSTTTSETTVTPENTTSTLRQSDFWQNLLSGTNLSSTSAASLPARHLSSSNASPLPPEHRDPRIKMSKSRSSDSDATQSDGSLKKGEVGDYHLVVMTVENIDYSNYYNLYRCDAKMKNDPRLERFFSKLTTVDSSVSKSETKPLPLSLSSLSTLSTTISLPVLPPLSLSQPKADSLSSIIPPAPPIMSPYELITSKPSLAVSETKSQETSCSSFFSNNVEKVSTETTSAPTPPQAHSKPIAPHLPQGLTNLASLVNSSKSTDLRRKVVKKSKASVVAEEKEAETKQGLDREADRDVTNTTTTTTVVVKQEQEEEEDNSDTGARDLSADGDEIPSIQSPAAMNAPLSPPASPPAEGLLDLSLVKVERNIPSPSSEGLTIDDEMATPTSPREDDQLPEELTVKAELGTTDEPVTSSTGDEEGDSIRDMFMTIDPTASPFC